MVLEATSKTPAITTALKQRVARGVVANHLQVRLIAEARIKTDKIDAAVRAVVENAERAYTRLVSR